MLRQFSKAYLIILILSSASFLTQAQTSYPVNWINQSGVNTSGGILIKPSSPQLWTNAGGISSNVLAANTDGWMEFSGGNGAHYIVGLASNNVIDYIKFSHAILMDHANNTYTTYEGTTATGLGSWQLGDVFRISREGNEVKYYRNGSVVRTVTVNPTVVLKIKASIKLPGKSTPTITTSFDGQLILQGSVAATEGTGNSGSISLSVLGGASPYTYSWSSGEETSTITNKPRGSYTVTVSDAAGRVQDRTYTIGYKVNWIDQFGVITNGSILTKTQDNSLWTSAGGISSNILPANTDGWMEFSGGNGAHYIVGLAANQVVDYDKFSNAIMIDYANNAFTTYEGTTATGFGSWQTGDVFRISREGNLVMYYRNSVVVRSVTVNPGTVLKVKVAIELDGKSTPYINTSFDGNLILQGPATATETSNGSGSISLTVSGGAAPYTYSWTSGEQTSSISNKPQGLYTVTVNDAAGRVQDRAYRLGYKLNWINTKGVSINGNILTKLQIPATWTDAGAISSNVLPSNTDGWIEFTGSYDAYYAVGFALNDVIDYDKFSYAFFIDYDNNTFRALEGEITTGLGSWQTGDVFRISREGNLVKYYRNEIVLRTVTVNPASVLKVKTSLRYPGKSTPNINTSFGGNLILYGTVSGMEGNTGSGSISLNVSGGAIPYTYSWSSGEQTSSISNKPRDSYAVTVSDAVGRIQQRTYNIGYKVNWINLIGVSLGGGILTKTAQGRIWTNAGAVSSNMLAANTDGWMEFSTDSGKDFIVGLATNNTIDYDEFSHAIFADHLTHGYVIYEGASGMGSGNWQTGDVFRISREGSLVKYYRNDAVIRTVTVNPGTGTKSKGHATRI